MMAKKPRIPHKFLPWIDARKKFRLSNAHIQMARELGLSPKRFGVYADTTGQPWKVPLPQFIEDQYKKQFDKARPDVVLSIEEIAAAHVAKRAARKARKLESAAQETSPEDPLTDERVSGEATAPVDDRAAEPLAKEPIGDPGSEPSSQSPNEDQ